MARHGLNYPARVGGPQHATATLPGCRRSASPAQFSPTGDQPGADRGARRRRCAPASASRRCSAPPATGKTATMAWRDRADRSGRRSSSRTTRPSPRSSATSSASSSRDNAVEYFVSLLRLLPARGVPARVRHVHREGLVDQRRHRPAAARGDVAPADAPRRDHRGVASPASTASARREEYDEHAGPPRASATSRPRASCSRPRRHPVRAQRRRARPRPVPRARRRGRGAAGVHGDGATAIELFGDEVESHHATSTRSPARSTRSSTSSRLPGDALRDAPPTLERAIEEIGAELEERRRQLRRTQGKLLEAHRLRQRTEYDLEMMREMGYCSGIENYSRILDGRSRGQPPFTLLDYFPRDFVCLHRRVARHRAADRRHVRGRPLAQDGARRARLPAAVGARQPPAAVRRVPRARRPDASSSRPRRATSSCATRRAGRRADHPPDRPRRPDRRAPPDDAARSTTCSARSAAASGPASACS